MSTNYPGIDYGLGQSNVDKANGIRYGVISSHSIHPEALDDVEYDYGEASMECPECKTINKVKEWGDFVECECGHEYDVELPDFAEPSGWKYEKQGYLLTDCLDSEVFVIKSPFYTFAQYCSPCCPGAGNLNAPFDGPVESWADAAKEAGFPKVYCLGHDWFEDGTAPYPIFSVETNEQVQP